MIALLMAASVASASPVQPAATETPNIYSPPARCRLVRERVRQQQQEVFRKLGRLPPAFAEYAVMRQVDGCMVAAPMGYHPTVPGEPGPQPK